MKFNKKERIILYAQAIIEFDNIIRTKDYTNCGFCMILGMLGWKDYFMAPFVDDLTKEFPELKKYKPNDVNIEWFDCDKKGAEKRIKILKCIISNYEL